MRRGNDGREAQYSLRSWGKRSYQEEIRSINLSEKSNFFWALEDSKHVRSWTFGLLGVASSFGAQIHDAAHRESRERIAIS